MLPQYKYIFSPIRLFLFGFYKREESVIFVVPRYGACIFGVKFGVGF